MKLQDKKTDTEVVFFEDNAEEAGLILYCLKRKGLADNVAHFAESTEGLDWLFGRNKYAGKDHPHPRLIILDINMPKINGIEVLKEIRADEVTKLIPVVMLTSSAEEKDVQRCYQAGANAYVVKPINFIDFSKAIEQLGIFWKQINHPPG